MKYTITLIIALIGTTLLSCSEADARNANITIVNDQLGLADDTTKQETRIEYLAEKLDPIRAYVASINSAHEWSLVHDQTIEVGEIEVKATYFLSNVLRKVVTSGYDKNGTSEASYYFKEGQLLYVFEKKQMELGDDGLVDLETESYFENGILIRSLDNQDCGAPYNQEYRDEEQNRITQDVDQIKKSYRLSR